MIPTPPAVIQHPGYSQALKVPHLCPMENLQKPQPDEWLDREELEGLGI